MECRSLVSFSTAEGFERLTQVLFFLEGTVVSHAVDCEGPGQKLEIGRYKQNEQIKFLQWEAFMLEKEVIAQRKNQKWNTNKCQIQN